MIIEDIKRELENHKDKEAVFKIGYIKEFLQTIILKEIYEQEKCKDLLFYGGTAIRFLFGLNRLSEDLDFIGQGFTDFDGLGKSLQGFFEKQGILVTYKIQKFRLTINFKNFLDNFNVHYGNSKDLYIKIEISDHFDFCKNFETKIYPIFKFNQSLVLRSLDKSTLFASKINAVLHRNRKKQVGDTQISIKGRDFYDLFRYLSKGFTPNINCIIGVTSILELKSKLSEIVTKTNFKEVILDIEPFVEDTNMIEFLEDHGKEYILEQIENW